MVKKSDPPPAPDLELTQSLLGRTVLVGVTFEDESKNIMKRRQFFGEIVSIHATKGVTLRNPVTGKELNLPPDFTGYTKAPPGQYTLKETGEVIENPELLATWVLQGEVPIFD